MARKRPASPVLTIARAFHGFLTAWEGEALLEVREQLNPYKREHLRLLWEAGWHAHRLGIAEGDGVDLSLLSKPARAAWNKGHSARETITALPTPKE